MTSREKKEFTASESYYSFLKNFVTTKSEDARVFGKYYTDWKVAQNLTDLMVRNNAVLLQKKSLNVIDPFSGDGRLIVCLLRSLKKDNYSGEVTIHLWDIDQTALANATQSIEAEAFKLKIKVCIDAKECDSFVEYHNHISSYDICVTNPPWGLIKPLKALSRRCSDQEWDNYRLALQQYQSYFEEEFSQPSSKKRFGKFGANLGRAGVEVSTLITKKNGVCGIVSPASLLTDQVSFELRQKLYEVYGLSEISYYPAELKLYGSADVSSVTIIMRNELKSAPIVYSYKNDDEFVILQFDESDLSRFKKDGYVFPLVPKADNDFFIENTDSFQTVLQYCNDNELKFCREIDETKIAEKLKSEGDLPFAKGFMVTPYEYTQGGLFLNTEMVTPPNSVYKPKIVWRDVSRSSQKKRIKATLLPIPTIAGNSLGQIVSEIDSDKNIVILLGFINSFVFEYLARRLLSSNHVSSGVIKQLMIPSNFDKEELLFLTRQAILSKHTTPDLEAKIALAYGVHTEQFQKILSTFELSDTEFNNFMEAYLNANNNS